MKTKNIILTIVLAAVVLGTWVIVRHYNKPGESSGQAQGHHDIYYCPMHPNYTSDHPGNCPICGMNLVKRETTEQAVSTPGTQKKILYWTDTMMPGYKSDHPGKSPMGMEMTPVYEQDTQEASGIQGYAAVSATAQKQQLAGIRTVIVEKKNMVKTVRAAGYISTNNDLYKLQDEYVQNYDNFITIYRDFKRFEHSRRNWEIHRELQLKLHDQEDKLLSLGLGQKQIEQLQKYSWQTPWNQQDLLFFNNTFEYWVVAQIFEDDLGSVKAGQQANVEIPAYGQKVSGILRSIGGVINPQTRTVNALIELKGNTGQLKGNMFVNVEIPENLNGAIVVPREAVMDTGVRKIIFVQKNEGTFEPRVIQTGWETDDGFEVKSGLKEGERIVVNGNFLLDSESRVQAGLEGDKAHD